MRIKPGKHSTAPTRPSLVPRHREIQALCLGNASSTVGRVQVPHRELSVTRGAAGFATEELCDLRQVTISFQASVPFAELPTPCPGVSVQLM